MRPWARRASALAAGVALTVAAVWVVRELPGLDDLNASLPVQTEVGERGTGRNLAAQVDGVLLADTVATPDWVGETSGVWVVVHAEAATVVSPGSLTGRLSIGDRTWHQSERPGGDSLGGVSLGAGLPWSGSLFFEVPADALEEDAAARARLELGPGLTAVIDSVIVVDLDLTAAEHETRLEVTEPERVVW